MIPSPNHSSRNGAKVRLIIVHTAEGSRTVESLGSWFSSRERAVSSHAGIDDRRLETYVPYDQAAWCTRSANPISDNVELCGFANWSRAEWLDKHQQMLELCAAWIRERCQARNIPIRKLSPSQVASGMSGVCGHVDWTDGMHDGTHRDPGVNFPWDHVMQFATGGTLVVPAGPDSLPRLAAGDIGDAVAHWQAWLVSQGATIDLGPRRFGPQTVAATAAFQRKAGVTGPDANGQIVGPRTLAAAWAAGYRG